MNALSISAVEYLGDYRLSLHFSDGHQQTINFYSFIVNSHHPDIQKYQEIEKFKQYFIIYGDLQWGDYEMCFPIEDLYFNKNIESRGSENHAA